jgi:hypothetical protein
MICLNFFYPYFNYKTNIIDSYYGDNQEPLVNTYHGFGELFFDKDDEECYAFFSNCLVFQS